MKQKKRIGLLGGTAEALLLARHLAGDGRLEIIYSLAGITKNPVFPEHAEIHMGGFGGISGMVNWLKSYQIDYMIDATHPFAVQMTSHAYQASQACSVPFIRLERPVWKKDKDDLWIEVYSWTEAVKALGKQPKNVFLTIGKKDLLPFRNCLVKHHYWIRSVDYPDPVFLPESSEVITAKGPFKLQDEYDFLHHHHIDYLVSKNSGGETVYAKILAARSLNIPVIMLQRKKQADFPCVDHWQKILSWIYQKAAFY